MDNFYAIYTYKPVKHNDEGDVFRDGQTKEFDLDKAQNLLNALFGKKGTLFRVQKEDGKEYTCDVYGNDSRIVALRLFNMKDEHYWEKVQSAQDPMGTVEKKYQLSTPCTYVIIDCRPGRNILAVKVETEAWRNTDTIRDLMEESINQHLKSLSSGFRVQLYTKMETRNAFEYSKRRIKKEGRTIKSMKIHFKTGKLNPVIESIVKTSTFLKGLFNVINKYALSGDIKLDKPIGEKVIDKRRRDIENIITLIISDPKGYGLDITFDDDVTLHCGKDSRAELPMEPEGALELFHIEEKVKRARHPQLELFPDGAPKSVAEDRYLIEGWLDSVAEQTEKMKDAETIKPKRSRKNKRKAS